MSLPQCFSARKLVRRLRARTRSQLRPPPPSSSTVDTQSSDHRPLGTRPSRRGKAPVVLSHRLLPRAYWGGLPTAIPSYWQTRLWRIFYRLALSRPRGSLSRNSQSVLPVQGAPIQTLASGLQTFQQHLVGTRGPAVRSHLPRPLRAADHIVLQQPFQCLVFKPTAESIWTLQWRGRNQKLPEVLVKAILRYVLLGLEYLHQEASMLYAVIQEHPTLRKQPRPARSVWGS
ncbi:hypothetical protein C8Q73DRAFT_75528 [Cubamyces lactineus]|nr:hypothetical protein C8Q73DRAFT_75528 [Cubamyces lactineus]